MKRIIYFNLLVGLMTMTGCNDNDWQGNVGNGNYQLHVQMERMVDSRTAVNESNQVVWLASDRIGVYGDQGTANVPFIPMSISEGGLSATFTGNLKSGEMPTAVYYPYDVMALVSDKELTLTLPLAYDYTENSNAPMIGVKQEDGSFRFNHLCGLLRIGVVGMPAGEMELEIVSEGENAPAIAGNAVVQDIYQTGAELVMMAGQSDRITISCQSSATSSKEFLIPLPDGVYPRLSVSLQSENQVYFEKSIIDCEIKRATILNMPEITLLPNAAFVLDSEDNELVLFDYQNNAIVFYQLRDNGLPQSVKVWNAKEGDEYELWSEMTFYEDGTLKSIAYDDTHVMAFSNYRQNSVDMGYSVDGEITLHKGLVCEGMDWDAYKKTLADRLPSSGGDGMGDLLSVAEYFAASYAEIISLAMEVLVDATSDYVGEAGYVYETVADWDTYWKEKYEDEHSDGWEFSEDVEGYFEQLRQEEQVAGKLEQFDGYSEFSQNGQDYFGQIESTVATSVQNIIEMLQNGEETNDAVIDIPPFEAEEW